MEAECENYTPCGDLLFCSFSVIGTDEEQIAAKLVKHGPLSSNYCTKIRPLLYYTFHYNFNLNRISSMHLDRCSLDANIYWQSFMPVCLF